MGSLPLLSLALDVDVDRSFSVHELGAPLSLPLEMLPSSPNGRKLLK